MDEATIETKLVWIHTATNRPSLSLVTAKYEVLVPNGGAGRWCDGAVELDSMLGRLGSICFCEARDVCCGSRGCYERLASLDSNQRAETVPKIA